MSGLYAIAQNISEERRIRVVGNQANTLACFDLSFYERRFKMIRKILASLLATLFLASAFGTLAGCNTMEGAGKDIQQGGKAITDEAKEQKDKR